MNVSKERLEEIFEKVNRYDTKILTRSENGRRTITENAKNNHIHAYRTSQIVRTCPHCNVSGKGNFFIGKHFSKCYFNPNNLDLYRFYQDSKELSLRSLSTKYSLPRASVTRFLTGVTHTLNSKNNLDISK